MRKLRINEVLKFIKGHTGPLKTKSNKELRTWIVKGLRNNNLYFVFNGDVINGMIEWYRYKNIEEIIWDFNTGKLNKFRGEILYINNYVIDDFRRLILRRFFNFHKQMGEIEKTYIMRYKNKRFTIKEMRGV